MKELSRWVVAFAVFGSVGGVGSTASGETPAFDSGTCFGATSCPCGYVCVSGYCDYRGSAAVPAECGSDSDCRPACSGQVCVDRRCVARTSSIDASAEAPWDGAGAPPPPDRPSVDDRVADVIIVRDVGIVPVVDRPLPPISDVPLPRDTIVIYEESPITSQDAGTTDAPAVVEETPTDDPGRLVQGCGCTVAGAAPARSWWALGLLGLALRRRSRRAR